MNTSHIEKVYQHLFQYLSSRAQYLPELSPFHEFPLAAVQGTRCIGWIRGNLNFERRRASDWLLEKMDFLEIEASWSGSSSCELLFYLGPHSFRISGVKPEAFINNTDVQNKDLCLEVLEQDTLRIHKLPFDVGRTLPIDLKRGPALKQATEEDWQRLEKTLSHLFKGIDPEGI